jgi:superfamily II DNA or RNA helicase
MIQKKAEFGRKVFFVHGDTDVDDREEIRRITESENDAIIVASFGTFSTGINIKRLHNIVFASPTKSKIRSLQSVGRGLRLGEGKDKAALYDIGDDLRHNSRVNFSLRHFEERQKIFKKEEFPIKIIKVRIVK